MEFTKYMHVENFGRDEVEGIEVGTCFLFPKLDGTNASIWACGGEVFFGSRNRGLYQGEDDNAGFREAIVANTPLYEALESFFGEFPMYTLFGEWLVPHTIKEYREDAWRKFYLFDIYNRETGEYLPFDKQLALLSYCDLLSEVLVHPLISIKNPTHEDLLKCMEKNTFLMEEGVGFGEGIVIKNYDFVNKYGRVVWAKLKTRAFLDRHNRTMGAPKVEREMVEQDIADEYITAENVAKTAKKIEAEHKTGWRSEYIPELLGRIYHDLVSDNMWEALKTFRRPVVDFKRLSSCASIRAKEVAPKLFGG